MSLGELNRSRNTCRYSERSDHRACHMLNGPDLPSFLTTETLSAAGNGSDSLTIEPAPSIFSPGVPTAAVSARFSAGKGHKDENDEVRIASEKGKLQELSEVDDHHV